MIANLVYKTLCCLACACLSDPVLPHHHILPFESLMHQAHAHTKSLHWLVILNWDLLSLLCAELLLLTHLSLNVTSSKRPSHSLTINYQLLAVFFIIYLLFACYLYSFSQ